MTGLPTPVVIAAGVIWLGTIVFVFSLFLWYSRSDTSATVDREGLEEYDHR
jgi:hypothetical protein